MLDLYVTLIEQGRPFNTNWSNVSMIIGSKDVSVSIKCSELSGAKTAKIGPWTLSVWIDLKCA